MTTEETRVVEIIAELDSRIQDLEVYREELCECGSLEQRLSVEIELQSLLETRSKFD